MYPRFGDQTWITPYGVALIAALGCAWLYARARGARIGIEPSHVDLALPAIFILAALGAKLLSLAAGSDNDLAGALFTTHFRFRVFGILGVGVPLLWVYARLAELSLRRLLDLFALPFVLWLGIVRIGCFLSGCCWGDLAIGSARLSQIADPGVAKQVLTLPWFSGAWVRTALRFPADSYAYHQHLTLGLITQDSRTSLPVHPTQLYELAALAVLLFALTAYERRASEAGRTATVMLLGYCAIRFLVEYVRADSALLVGNLTLTQVLCVLVALVAAPVLFVRARR